MKIVTYHNGNYFIFTDPEYLKKMLANAGRPGRPVIRDNIHWIPHI
jgi:hypothetical protein